MRITLIIFLLAISLAIVSPALAAQPSDQLFVGMNTIHGEVSSDSPWLFFSSLINSFLSQGVELEIIYLLLAVPFITFIIAFFRQVIGVSTFGVYTPLILALTFLLLGILFGLITLIFVIITSYILRLVLNRINLLYIPRASLVLSIISLSFFIIIWFGLQFGSSVAISLAIFPMLVMSTVAERFLSAQSEEGISGAVRGAAQTVVVAIIAYFVVIWPWLADKIIGVPEIVLLPVLGSLLLGKFTGLRWIEFFRFRTLFRENIEEE